MVARVNTASSAANRLTATATAPTSPASPPATPGPSRPRPTRGKYAGVAPGATLIAVRVSDDLGQTYLSDVIEGIDWVIANRQAYNIRVLNLSMQSTVAESATTSYLAAAVERAWLNGILVVVAAGNHGPNAELYPPANDPFVVTVGADDPMTTTSRADDGMADLVQLRHHPGRVHKPDVVAPGRFIASNLASGSPVLGALFPERVVDGQYLWLSGTSMAAPQVAGVAALAFQRNPLLTNDAVKWLLSTPPPASAAPRPRPARAPGWSTPPPRCCTRGPSASPTSACRSASSCSRPPARPSTPGPAPPAAPGPRAAGTAPPGPRAAGTAAPGPRAAGTAPPPPPLPGAGRRSSRATAIDGHPAPAAIAAGASHDRVPARPVLERSEAMQQQPEAPAAGRPAARTILVVDDDDDIRSLLRTTIERGSHRVEEASDGEEALLLIGRARPDLILLDVNMPGIDGPAVCRHIKADAATRGVTVLMLTAATQDSDRRRGMEAGADGYISKPFSPRSLLDQVGSHLSAASACRARRPGKRRRPGRRRRRRQPDAGPLQTRRAGLRLASCWFRMSSFSTRAAVRALASRLAAFPEYGVAPSAWLSAAARSERTSGHRSGLTRLSAARNARMSCVAVPQPTMSSAAPRSGGVGAPWARAGPGVAGGAEAASMTGCGSLSLTRAVAGLERWCSMDVASAPENPSGPRRATGDHRGGGGSSRESAAAAQVSPP